MKRTALLCEACLILLMAAAAPARTDWTVVDLNPLGAVSSAEGVYGNQQVGDSGPGGAHAAIWSGTASSCVDLNPDGAIQSRALATSVSQQAGYTFVPTATMPGR